jgi:hypothetical protein
MRNTHKILIAKPEGKRGKPNHIREKNIRMNLTEMGREDVEWLHLAQDTDRQRAFRTRYWIFGFHNGVEPLD